MASTGKRRRFSSAVATQVASAMTKGEEHLLYRCDSEADRPHLSASTRLHADPASKIRRDRRIFVAMTGFRQLRRLAAASEAICLRHD